MFSCLHSYFFFLSTPNLVPSPSPFLLLYILLQSGQRSSHSDDPVIIFHQLCSSFWYPDSKPSHCPWLFHVQLVVQLCCAVSHAPLLTLLLLLCLCLSSLLIQFTPYGQMISPLLSVSQELVPVYIPNSIPHHVPSCQTELLHKAPWFLTSSPCHILPRLESPHFQECPYSPSS